VPSQIVRSFIAKDSQGSGGVEREGWMARGQAAAGKGAGWR